MRVYLWPTLSDRLNASKEGPPLEWAKVEVIGWPIGRSIPLIATIQFLVAPRHP